MKRALLIALLPIQAWAGLFRQATSDPRVNSISYTDIGEYGHSSLLGAVACPKGKVWYIQQAGIILADTTKAEDPYREFMMQVVTYNPAGNGGIWLFPIERPVGKTAGTPVLALGRPIILKAGQSLAARVDNLPADQRMGIMFDGWEIDATCLPELLGIGPSTTAAASQNREILNLEAELNRLKAQ